MEYRSIEVRGGTLAYAEYEGTKGTIIGIHGLTGNLKQLHYFAELLKGDYRVILIDVRGRGNSSEALENTGIKTHSEDVMALIDQLQIENPILMGYSMGGFIAGSVASRRDDIKGVILLDGAASMTDHQRQIVQPSLGRISKHYESPEEYLKEIKQIYTNLGVEWGEHMESVGQYEIHQVDGHWENKSDEAKIRQDFDSFYDFHPREVFSKVDCPILLVHCTGEIGKMPALFLRESYAETLKFSKDIHKVTSDSNHYTLVFENRDDVNPIILNFLNNL